MDFQLGVIETKFADIIWENEPVQSSKLVALCADAFGWKKSTTYTVLSRLCKKGLFVNDGTVVRSLISQKDFHSRLSCRFVEDSFGGSLPAFFAAFFDGKKITPEQADELQAMIDKYRKEQ